MSESDTTSRKQGEISAAQQDPYIQIRIGFALVALLIFAASAIVMLIVRNPTPVQYEVFRSFMALGAAILFQVIGGTISFKTEAFAAFGGIAVWAAYPFIFGPLPTKTTLAVYVQVDGVPLAESVDVTIRYADESQTVRTSTNGQVMFRVPTGLDSLDSIIVGDGSHYQPTVSGPYAISPDTALTIEVAPVHSGDVQGIPETPNEATVIPSMPDEGDVLGHKVAHSPEGVTLTYLNSTRTNMTLWLFDCWKYYKNMHGYWKELDFPRMDSPRTFDEFSSKRDGNGIYCIVIEFAPNQYEFLGTRHLFDTPSTHLEVSGDDDEFVLK